MKAQTAPFEPKLRLSFKRQFILAFMAGLLFLIVPLAASLVEFERRQIHHQRIEETINLAKSLARASLSWVLANDTQGLEEVVGSFRSFPGLRYAMVISPSGRVLAHSDATKVGQFLSDEKSTALLEALHEDQIITDDWSITDVAVPISLDNRYVGWARVGLGRGESFAEFQRFMLASGVVALAAMVSSLLAALLIANRLGRRIGLLVNLANEVRGGNFSTRASLRGDDEIAVLADGMNQMLDALAKHEQRSRESSRYTRSLIEASIDPMVTISPDGKITDVNESTMRVTGATRAALIGSDFSNYFTEPEKARAGYEEVFVKGNVKDYPLAIRHISGKVVDVLYNASLYCDDKGEAAGVFAVARDVTEWKRIEGRYRQLAAIVESSGDAIFSTTLEGVITTWNVGAQQMFGYALEEAIGMNVSVLAAPERKEEVCRNLALIRDGGRVSHYETMRRRKDGKEIYVSLSLSSVKDAAGNINGVSAILRDITDRKRAEDALEVRVRQQAAIAELGVHMLEANDLPKSLDEAARVVAGTLGVDYCEILERRENAETLRLHHGFGWKNGVVGRTTVDAGAGSQGGYTLLSATPVIVEDLRNERRFTAPPLLLEHNVVSGMSVVIGGRDSPFGVLGAHTASRRVFSVDDVNFLQAAANVIAATVEQIRAAQYMRSLIEASLDPLVTISATGKITDVNEATVQATGVSREAMIGSDFADYFTEPDKARAGYQKAYTAGFVRDYPLAIRHTSGRVMDVLYNASVYRDERDETAGVLAAARDITERKRAEEELRIYHQQLEELVSLRTADLAKANDNLAVVNAELESFAYSVSHDLRVPLRAIDGFSRILLEDYSGKIDAEGQRLLTVVRDSTVKLARLIDDILAFSRAGRTEMTSARIDMDELVKDVVKELEPAFVGRKLTFVVKPLASAHGDAAMVRRIWTNLIDNAVKFTAPKPEAFVEIGSTATPAETIYYVRDNGAGFDMRYASKLFGVFQRLHGVEFAGTGIGLAIVKRIVARHGGRVWAEGKVNEGATFYFTLAKRENSHA